ncbi:MAG: RipA family octameric membrane protein [Planctomycetota bacterium]|jgi:hypothetical protein
MAKKKVVKKTTSRKPSSGGDPTILAQYFDTAVGLKRQERNLHLLLFITILGAHCILLACYSLTVGGASLAAGAFALFGVVFSYYWYLHSYTAGLRVGYWEEACRNVSRELMESLNGSTDLFEEYKGVDEERIVKIIGDEGQPIDSAVQSLNAILKAVPFVFGGLWILLLILSIHYLAQ